MAHARRTRPGGGSYCPRYRRAPGTRLCLGWSSSGMHGSKDVALGVDAKPSHLSMFFQQLLPNDRGKLRVQEQDYCTAPHSTPILRIRHPRHSIRMVVWKAKRAHMAHYWTSRSRSGRIRNVIGLYEHGSALRFHIPLRDRWIFCWVCYPRMGLCNMLPTPEKKSVSYAIVNSFANLAYVYCAYLWPASDSPKYTLGFSAMVAFAVGSILCAWAMRFWLMAINRRTRMSGDESKVFYAY